MSDDVNTGGDSSASAAAIAAGSSIFNNLLNIGFAARSDRKAREWQEQMWNKQNLYNLPTNQVVRLKMAGINPNLAFGSQASSMSASIPSSPTTHVPRLEDPYTAAIAAKQAMANVRRQNEDTRREKLNNDLTELLFNDMVYTKRATLGADYLSAKWMWEHGYDKMDEELVGLELMNDVRRAEEAYTKARTSMTYQNLQQAKFELEHLRAKYKFEDSYYNSYLNPYETSTPLGVARTITGAAAKALDWVEWSIKSRFGKRDIGWHP